MSEENNEIEEVKSFQEAKSFEENIKNAQELLEKLIDPEITLSQSVAIYKEGLNELEEARQLLDKAKLEFQELSSSS